MEMIRFSGEGEYIARYVFSSGDWEVIVMEYDYSISITSVIQESTLYCGPESVFPMKYFLECLTVLQSQSTELPLVFSESQIESPGLTE
jgi:hypothetical protein